MKKTTQILTIIAGLIFLLSFFLPSRLTSYDLETIISFAKSNQIGYSLYVMILFPIAFGFLFCRKFKIAFIISIILILINSDQFESALNFILSDNELFGWGFVNRILPYLILCGLSIWLVYKSLNTNKWIWYFTFIGVTITSYLWLNDRNCTIEFFADYGIKRYDIPLWFNNCGTYYAWWIAPIILNIGLFNEIRNKNSA